MPRYRLDLRIVRPVSNPGSSLNFLPLCQVFRAVMIRNFLAIHLLLVLLLLGCRPMRCAPYIVRMPSISCFLPFMAGCKVCSLGCRFLHFIPARFGRNIAIWHLLL